MNLPFPNGTTVRYPQLRSLSRFMHATSSPLVCTYIPLQRPADRGFRGVQAYSVPVAGCCVQEQFPTETFDLNGQLLYWNKKFYCASARSKEGTPPSLKSAAAAAAAAAAGAGGESGAR